MYLLDTNTLLRASLDYYPIHRIPQFWDWLIERGNAGLVKIPTEIMAEFKYGPAAEWLQQQEVKDALLLDEAVHVPTFRHVVTKGYAPDLSDAEQVQIGRDPFLIAHGCTKKGRTVVTKEVSRPSAKRANRQIPDVCDAVSVRWITDFQFYEEADFRVT